MKTLTLFCKVGRANPQALASFDNTDSAAAEIACNAVQFQKTAELLNGGNALTRISFERVYTGEQTDTKPEEKRRAKKGEK